MKMPTRVSNVNFFTASLVRESFVDAWTGVWLAVLGVGMAIAGTGLVLLSVVGYPLAAFGRLSETAAAYLKRRGGK